MSSPTCTHHLAQLHLNLRFLFVPRLKLRSGRPADISSSQICCAARPAARADKYLCRCLLRDATRLSERMTADDKHFYLTLMVCSHLFKLYQSTGG